MEARWAMVFAEDVRRFFVPICDLWNIFWSNYHAIETKGRKGLNRNRLEASRSKGPKLQRSMIQWSGGVQ